MPILITSALFIFATSFIAWIFLSIKYVFHEEYLLVKGGPFRSEIRYEDIMKVTPTTEIFTGYRILSSKKAIEIFYKNASLGSVTISPKDSALLLFELENRCMINRYDDARE